MADGKIGTLEASYWLAPESKRQRMCIAKHSPSSPWPWKTKCSLAGSTPCLCWNALLRFCVPQQFCSRPSAEKCSPAVFEFFCQGCFPQIELQYQKVISAPTKPIYTPSFSYTQACFTVSLVPNHPWTASLRAFVVCKTPSAPKSWVWLLLMFTASALLDVSTFT